MRPSVALHDFDDLQEEWERLLPSCHTNTVFVTPPWQRTWWDSFGYASQLRLLSVRTGDTLIGIAPLRETDGVLRFIGDTDLCDYNDFLVRRGSEEAFYPAILDYLDGQASRIELPSVPESSPTLRNLPPQAESRGYTVTVEQEDVAPVASLPTTWDDFVASLGKKDRHELRRKMRRLDAAGSFTQHVCQDPDAIADGMADFLRLHRDSRPDKKRFMNAERERFFTKVAVELGARGQLKLAFLELDQIRVATCIYFDYIDSYLLYNSGYDPAYSNLSVGLLNKALAIRQAIEAGKRSFDFLRGDERYKYDLGGKDRRVFRLTLHR